MTALLAALRALGNAGAVHNAAAAIEASRHDRLVVEALLRRLPVEAPATDVPAAA